MNEAFYTKRALADARANMEAFEELLNEAGVSHDEKVRRALCYEDAAREFDAAVAAHLNAMRGA
jgi:hypothetical protein